LRGDLRVTDRHPWVLRQSNRGHWEAVVRPDRDARGDAVKVDLRNPRRTVVVPGPMTVRDLMTHLDLAREAHLVIRGDSLVTADERLSDEDHVEVRPVISGG
jgi:sulfur carrier protein